MTFQLDRRTFLTATLAGGAGFAGGAALVAGPALAAPDPMSKEAVLYDPEAPVLGNPKGDVTIVEWFDYQCPYCSKLTNTLHDLVDANPGKVRVVFKHFPLSFHKQARPAANAAMAAREQGILPTTEGSHNPKLILTQILDGYAGNEHALPIAPLHPGAERYYNEQGWLD